MESLKELIQIINKNKIKHIEVLDSSRKYKSKVYQLYEGIANGSFNSDEAAASFFFNDSPQNQQYRNLKVELKRKLFNTILFVDDSNEGKNNFQKLHNLVLKKWTALKILMNKGAYKISIPSCKALLRLSKKAELTEITIDILKSLRYYYAVHNINQRLFLHYDTILRKNLKIQEKEFLVEGLYLRLSQLYVKQKSQKQDLSNIYKEFLPQIENCIDNSSTSRILLYAGVIEVGNYLHLFQYQKAINSCNKILSILEEKEIQKNSVLLVFLLNKLACHTQLKQYEEGTDCISKLDAYLEEGTFNWFKGKEVNMYLLLHTKKYQYAYELFFKVYNHKKFKKLPEPIKETWEIFRAYLHYLIILDYIQPVPNDTNFKNFRINRFLNTVPVFSQDKRGFNIAILVVQIIFSILQKKYDLMFDRMEAIEKYSTRYLKKDANFRSNCFIKILMEIPKASFHRIGVERRAEKYVTRLSEVPLEIANQLFSIEIIPYEDLWPMVLKTLSFKRLDGM